VDSEVRFRPSAQCSPCALSLDGLGDFGFAAPSLELTTLPSAGRIHPSPETCPCSDKVASFNCDFFLGSSGKLRRPQVRPAPLHMRSVTRKRLPSGRSEHLLRFPPTPNRENRPTARTAFTTTRKPRREAHFFCCSLLIIYSVSKPTDTPDARTLAMAAETASWSSQRLTLNSTTGYRRIRETTMSGFFSTAKIAASPSSKIPSAACGGNGSRLTRPFWLVSPRFSR